MSDTVQPVVETRDFGCLAYDPGSVLLFPAGLPGFEARRRFVPVSLPHTEPLLYLQSLEDPALCFVTLPMAAVDPSYRLEVAEEDLELLEFAPGTRAVAGANVLCLAVVSLKESGPTANLLAPVVVNHANGRAVQAIAAASEYSWEQPLLPAEAPACS